MASLYSVSTPSTYKDLVNQQRAKYHILLAEGKIEPLVYPFALLPALLPIAYLLFPWFNFPRLRFLRFPIFGFIVYISIWISRNCRSPSKGVDYGIGFVACFSVYLSVVTILLNNPQEEFFRIWRRRPESLIEEKNNTHENSQVQEAAMVQNPKASDDGHSLSRRKNNHLTKEYDDDTRQTGNQSNQEEKIQGRLFLQGFPRNSFGERLDWVFGFFTSHRGVGWNWCIDGLPPPPKAIQHELHESCGIPLYPGNPRIGPTGNRGYSSRKELLRRRLTTCIFFYLVLDLLKVWLMKDQYFWGFVDAPAPPCLPLIFHRSNVMLRTYRMILSMTGIYSALLMLFSSGDLFFAGLLGPKLINVAGEPWIYPDKYGSIAMVFDKGLAGFWGGWWHQLFRFTFSSPSKWILRRWNIDRKSTVGKLIQLFIAFGMSGALHASGSYGQLPDTNPLSGPFLFFFLQSFGMIGEAMLVGQLKKMGLWDRIPSLIKRAGNITWVLVWFYFTSPLLTEDFSRGGIWLFEPVPISPLRGLGYGLESEGWLTYDLPLGTWHRGSRWWLSGVAI